MPCSRQPLLDRSPSSFSSSPHFPSHSPPPLLFPHSYTLDYMVKQVVGNGRPFARIFAISPALSLRDIVCQVPALPFIRKHAQLTRCCSSSTATCCIGRRSSHNRATSPARWTRCIKCGGSICSCSWSSRPGRPSSTARCCATSRHTASASDLSSGYLAHIPCPYAVPLLCFNAPTRVSHCFCLFNCSTHPRAPSHPHPSPQPIADEMSRRIEASQLRLGLIPRPQVLPPAPPVVATRQLTTAEKIERINKFCDSFSRLFSSELSVNSMTVKDVRRCLVEHLQRLVSDIALASARQG
jgi:hypothetical protein